MKKGIALIITLFVITVLVVFSAAFVSISINQNINVDIFKRRLSAYNLAEAGLDRAITWLRWFTQQGNGSPPTCADRVNPCWNNPWNAGVPSSVGGGTYNVDITDLGLVGGTGGTERYRVTSIGSFGNIKRKLTNIMQIDSYANYIWLTNSEIFGNANVWFWNADHLNGRMHTNGHYNIYGDPVFEGEVHSVDNYIRFYNNGNNINSNQLHTDYDHPYFQEGVDFGALPEPPSGKWPSQAVNLRAAASNGGLSLTGNTTIVLNSSGTMNLTNDSYCNNCTTTCDSHGHNCHTTCNPRQCANIPLPANGALFVNNGTLTLSGTLNGRLTVGAKQDINIPNSIVYADKTSGSNDVLGIISEGDVVVNSTPSSPNNIEIDGCIMALNTSFMVDRWEPPPPYGHGNGTVKGTLTVFGGIIQNERGPVGTFSGSTKRSGFDKNYSYDGRLLTDPPPFMPTTGDYVTLSWEED